MNAEDQAVITNGRIEVYNEIEHANIECFGRNPAVLQDKIPVVMADFHASVDKLLTLDEKHFDKMTDREQADCFIASSVVEAVIEKVRDFLPLTPVEITDKCGITRVYENTREHFDTTQHPEAISENKYIESSAGERIRDFYSDYNGDRDDTQMRQNYTEMFTAAEIDNPQIETIGQSRVEANPDYNSFLSSTSNEDKIAEYHEFINLKAESIPDVDREGSASADSQQDQPISSINDEKTDKDQFSIEQLSGTSQRTIGRISSPDFKDWLTTCDHSRSTPEERSNILEKAVSGDKASAAKLRNIYIQVTTGDGRQEPYSKYMAADLGKLIGEISRQTPDNTNKHDRPSVETRDHVDDDIAKWVVSTFNFAAQALYADSTESFIKKAGGEKGLRDYQEARSEFIHALGAGDKETAARYGSDLEHQISNAEKVNGSRLEINDRTGSGLFDSNSKLAILGEKAIYGTDGRVAKLNQMDPWQAWSALKFAATATFTSKEDWKERYGTEKTVGFGSMVAAFGNFAQSLSGTGIFKAYASAAFSGMLSYADRMEKDTPVSQPDALPDSKDVIAGVSHAVYSVLEQPDSNEAQALRAQIGNDRFDSYTDNLRQYLDTGDRTYLDKASEALGTEIASTNDTERNPPSADSQSSYAEAIDKLRGIDSSHNRYERIESQFNSDKPEQQTTGRYRLDTRDTVEVWKTMSAYWKGLTSDDPNAKMDFRLSGKDPDMGRGFTVGGMFMMVNAFVSTDIGYTVVKHVFEKIIESVKDIEAHSEKGVINTILDTIENDFGQSAQSSDVSNEPSDPVLTGPVTAETNQTTTEKDFEIPPADAIINPVTVEAHEGNISTDDMAVAASEESQGTDQPTVADEKLSEDPPDVILQEPVDGEEPQTAASNEITSEQSEPATVPPAAPVTEPVEPSVASDTTPATVNAASDIPSYFSSENTNTTQELYDKLHDADPSITPEVFCDQLSAEFCSMVDSGLRDPSECRDFVSGLTEFYNACPDSIAHDMSSEDMFDTFLSNITGSNGEPVFPSNPITNGSTESATKTSDSTPIHDYSSVSSGEGVTQITVPSEPLALEQIHPDITVTEPLSVDIEPVTLPNTDGPSVMVGTEEFTPGENALSSFMTGKQGNLNPTTDIPQTDTTFTTMPNVDIPLEISEEPVVPDISIGTSVPEQPVAIAVPETNPVDNGVSQSGNEEVSPPVTTSEPDAEDFDFDAIDLEIPEI